MRDLSSARDQSWASPEVSRPRGSYGDKSGDEALQDVIDNPSGDAKGWYVIIRDGPLSRKKNCTTGIISTKSTGEVYILWRKTRELAVEQLKLHQSAVRDGKGAPLRELHSTSLNYECNFGFYEDGSFLLLNASNIGSKEHELEELKKKLREAEELSVDFPLPENLQSIGCTVTDEYVCPGCGDSSGEAEVIIGGGANHLWCTLDCFRKNPPKGWVTPKMKDLILERDGAEKAEELLEEKIEDLKDELRHAEEQTRDLKDNLHDLEMDKDYELERAQCEWESARNSLVIEINTLRDARSEPSSDKVRIAELETILSNSPLVTPIIGKFCGKACAVSTGLCGSLTYGWGELSDNGYWEYPCDLCINQEYPMNANDNDRDLYNSHDDMPSIEEIVSDKVNKQVQKTMKKAACTICNKKLANKKGVQEHQRSTRCGIVLGMMGLRDDKYRDLSAEEIYDDLLKMIVAKAQPITVKTETVSLAEIDYKRDVIKYQVIQTLVRWVSTAAAITTIAYHVV